MKFRSLAIAGLFAVLASAAAYYSSLTGDLRVKY